MAPKNRLNFLNRPSYQVAPLLLGAVIERIYENRVKRYRIVETEAYDQIDEASHSNRGKTMRTEVMFGKSGYAYIYFIYGLYHCFNIVTDKEGYGSAVLIRSIEPIDDDIEVQKLNGPAKLCRELGIDRSLNGHNLLESPIRLLPQSKILSKDIICTKRIGISKAVDVEWRFYIKNNMYVSKK